MFDILTVIAAWFGAITAAVALVWQIASDRRRRKEIEEERLEIVSKPVAAWHRGTLVRYRPRISGPTYHLKFKIEGATWDPHEANGNWIESGPSGGRYVMVPDADGRHRTHIIFRSGPPEGAFVDFKVVESNSNKPVVRRRVYIE
ncbi:hypothetical protein [Maricaulis sp.]|uniref:hypothetical protein n=1 Tax=Maricaulis sp. TaxID=1486257 RepID=UPI001B0B8967|nr:hypothetical protein [Maricaulis sp.]MBO6764420.1 hypothetical protein [Maricaulis sp.]